MLILKLKIRGRRRNVSEHLSPRISLAVAWKTRNKLLRFHGGFGAEGRMIGFLRMRCQKWYCR